MNKTMDNQTNYESGGDVLGNSGHTDNMAIRKISKSAAVHVQSDIQDRIEISSNKDVDIGLELLVNNEKKNYKDDRLTNNNLVSGVDNGIRMDTLNNEPDNLLVEDMLSNLDLDKTSTISQNDIDKLIDHADRGIPQRRPELVSAKDIENAIDNTSMPVNNPTATQNSFHTNNYSSHPPMEDPGVVRRKKQEIIYKLDKMRRLGINGIRKFNMSNSLQEMEDELSRVKYERELESSVKFQRKCLMAFVTGSELLNNKFDFLDFKLDGWSEQVHDNIDEYNEVFEELATKYKSKVKMAPEIRLMFMLGGSAFMFHLTNSMFKNSIPGMEDIMKQNPDLMKQFANAAINQMQGEERQAAEVFNTFQGAARGGSQPKSPLKPENLNSRTGLRNPVNSFTPAYAPSPPPSARASADHGYTRGPSPVRNMSIPTKMSAPVGVDDILNELRSNTAQSIDESIKSRTSNNDVADILSTTSSKKISLNRKRGKSKRNIILNVN